MDKHGADDERRSSEISSKLMEMIPESNLSKIEEIIDTLKQRKKPSDATKEESKDEAGFGSSWSKDVDHLRIKSPKK